jgi:hypothetical protein
MNRHKLKRFLSSLTRVKTWQLVIIWILLIFASVTLIRVDGLQLDSLRQAVLTADENGNLDEIRQAVTDLRSFTFTHTALTQVESNGENTLVLGTGPFYLENQYIRTAQAAIQHARDQLTADNPTGPGSDIYDKSAEYCNILAKQYGWRSWGKAHIDCVLEQLSQYPSQGAIQDLKTAMIPSTALYYHNYAAPLWAPTPAGWTSLAVLVLTLIIILRILTSVILRLILRFSRPRHT